MEKFKVSFEANNQQLKALGTKHASDTYADIEATFVLGERWTDMDSVSAVWWNDFTRVATVLDSQGKCIVPHEVLARKGCVRVNLVGSIVEGDELITRLTSYSAEAVQVNEKIKLTGSETSELTPSQFEQFVTEVKADADRAEAGATASAQSAQSASESATASANSATSSAQSATASAQSAQDASESATSAENAKDDAEDARDKILGMRATAETLEAGSDATASYSDGLLTLGIPRGDKGEQGIQGETGATPSFSIGEVDTLEPNESATATITGTAENPVLNLGLPQGRTGEVSLEDLEALLPTDTASGSIVTITDGQSVVPAKSLKVALEPIQDLHGYDKPWVGGAGKNLFDSLVFPETASQTILYLHYEVQNGTYTMSTPDFPLVNGITNVYFLAGAVSSGASSGSNGVSQSTPITITVTDGHYTVAYRSTNDVNTNNPKNFKWQIESGNSATTFAPYSNICPISGRTSVETTRTGKNLLDTNYGFDSRTINGVTFTVNADKSITVNGTATATAFFNLTFKGAFETSKPMPQLAGKTVTAKCKNALANPRINIEYFKADGTNGGIFSLANDNAVTRTIPSDFYSFRAYIVVSAGATADNVTLYPQIELGTEVAEYEPYQGTTYTTALGRTVYGGTLDVVSGVLNVTMGYIASYNGETIGEPWISDRDEYVAGTTPSIGAEVAYTLATPQTYQLTPTEVDLLLGQNNLWTNCGSVEVTYNADIQRYIDKKLSGNSTTSMLSMSRPMVQTETTETEETETETAETE